MSDMFPPPEAPHSSGPLAGAEAGAPPGAPPSPPHGAVPPAAEAEAAEPAYPWEADPPPDEEFGPDGRRIRHDAFTPRRKRELLTALVATGCLLDACRRIGVAPATVYRHQEQDPAFAEHCRIAVRMTAAPVEIAAWQRAVEGVEQEFACGGEVHVRRRYSDGLLRLLLQGSNPKKFGPNPGFSRKRLARWERKRMAREIRGEIEAEISESQPSLDQAVESILKKLDAIERHEEPAKRAAGWTKSPDGHWIPPGYAPVPGWTAPAAPDAAAAAERATDAPEGGARAEETPRDSV
jgi:hypothetical protein